MVGVALASGLLAIDVWRRYGDKLIEEQDARDDAEVFEHMVDLKWRNTYKEFLGMTDQERASRAAAAAELIKNYSPVIVNSRDEEERSPQPSANLDSSTLNLLTVSFQRPDAAVLALELATKYRKWYVTETALREYMVAVRDHMSYRRPDELIAAALILIKITVVTDDPTERWAALLPFAREKQNDFTIFGTGDRLGAVTFTDDTKAIEAAYHVSRMQNLPSPLTGWRYRLHASANLRAEARSVAN
jgi:hypothetical protein